MATSSVDSVFGIGENSICSSRKLNGEYYDYSNPAENIGVLPDEVESHCREIGNC